MRARSTFLVSAIVAVIAAIAAAIAVAGPTVTGKNGIAVTTDVKVSPKKLSKTTPKPASFSIKTKMTSSGVLSPLTKEVIDFDQAGKVFAQGLPTCSESILRKKAPNDAKRECKGADIGQGDVTVIFSPPEAKPATYKASILAFNGGRKGGKQVVLLQAYAAAPIPATYVFTGTISNRKKEGFGTRFELPVGSILGGAGAVSEFNLTIGKKFTSKGKKRSYVSSTCPSAKKLKVRVGLTYADGETIAVPTTQSCKS